MSLIEEALLMAFYGMTAADLVSHAMETHRGLV